MWESDPEPPRAFGKGRFTTLQNLANRRSDGGILQSTALIGENRQLSLPLFPAARHYDLIGVRVDDQIGIVRDDDDLPADLRLLEPWDQFIKNRFWIEVLFGLVDDQRPVILLIDREVKQQQDDAPRSGRELLNVDLFILKSIRASRRRPLHLLYARSRSNHAIDRPGDARANLERRG